MRGVHVSTLQIIMGQYFSFDRGDGKEEEKRRGSEEIIEDEEATRRYEEEARRRNKELKWLRKLSETEGEGEKI